MGWKLEAASQKELLISTSLHSHPSLCFALTCPLSFSLSCSLNRYSFFLALFSTVSTRSQVFFLLSHLDSFHSFINSQYHSSLCLSRAKPSSLIVTCVFGLLIRGLLLWICLQNKRNLSQILVYMKSISPNQVDQCCLYIKKQFLWLLNISQAHFSYLGLMPSWLWCLTIQARFGLMSDCWWADNSYGNCNQETWIIFFSNCKNVHYAFVWLSIKQCAAELKRYKNSNETFTLILNSVGTVVLVWLGVASITSFW